MLNTKQIASGKAPIIGQVWYSESSQNYFRIDEIDGDNVKVFRIAYGADGNTYKASRIYDLETHWWKVNSFKPKDLRVVSVNPARFESTITSMPQINLTEAENN